MAISDQQYQDLNAQYKTLRSQGMDSATATQNIKNKLQSTVVENPTAGTSSTAFDMLKSSYQSGGKEGDWIGSGTPSPTTTTVNESAGTVSPPTV